MKVGIKTVVSSVFALQLLALAVPASAADTVTAVKSYQSDTGFHVSFQLASAPGVWIGTDTNAMIAPIVEAAEGIAAPNGIYHMYEASYGQEEVTQLVVTELPASANQVMTLSLWQNSDGVIPSDSVIVVMGDQSSCLAGWPDQAYIAAQALYSRKPVTLTTHKEWFWEHGSLTQETVCSSIQITN